MAPNNTSPGSPIFALRTPRLGQTLLRGSGVVRLLQVMTTVTQKAWTVHLAVFSQDRCGGVWQWESAWLPFNCVVNKALEQNAITSAPKHILPAKWSAQVVQKQLKIILTFVHEEFEMVNVSDSSTSQAFFVVTLIKYNLSIIVPFCIMD